MGKIKKLTTHDKKKLISHSNHITNISLPKSNIFLNKCYQNKPILLYLPKITSTYAEIKGKHKCVGGVTFIRATGDNVIVLEKRKCENGEKKTRRTTILLWIFLIM